MKKIVVLIITLSCLYSSNLLYLTDSCFVKNMANKSIMFRENPSFLNFGTNSLFFSDVEILSDFYQIYSANSLFHYNNFSIGITTGYQSFIPELISSNGLTKERNVDVSRLLVGVATSYIIKNIFGVGASIKYHYNNMAGYRSVTPIFDFGLNARFEPVVFHLSFRNLFGNNYFLDSKERIPFSLGFGILYETDSVNIKKVDINFSLSLKALYQYAMYWRVNATFQTSFDFQYSSITPILGLNLSMFDISFAQMKYGAMFGFGINNLELSYSINIDIADFFSHNVSVVYFLKQRG